MATDTSAAEDEWRPVRVLPDLGLKVAIEGGVIAIAPPDDARIVELRARHQTFDQLLARFKDAFGQELAPATMIVLRDAPPSGDLSVEAVAGFRDIVAACVIPSAHAANLVHGARGRVSFSDHFAIYPWMIDKHYEHMVVYTPAVHGLHDVDEFAGQGLATISTQQLSPSEIDSTLSEALCARWRKRYIDGDDSWENRALFRSLNMANSAMLVPSGSETTQYDVGRSIALWGSAFEILVHEGPGGSSGTQQVVGLIEKLSWKSEKAAAKTNASERKADKNLYSLGGWLYFRLNDARNAFLHGNPIGPDVFETPKGKHLWRFAAPLYRLALTSFLDLKFERALPAVDDVEELASFISDRAAFEEVQGLCERALLTAIEDKPERIRRARTLAVDEADND